MSDQHLTDKEIDAVLRTWLQDAPAGPPDRSRVAGTVVRQLHSTRRHRRRWWPWPVSRREAMTPIIPPGPAGQRGPIPATHGHTPTVIGRTRAMLSPVTTIAASALVLALGSAFFIAEPFEQKGVAPGAENQAVAPTWVTGNIEYAPSCSGPDAVVDGDVRHDWNYECSPQTWTASDPRLSGQVSSRWNEDVYRTEKGIVAVNSTVDFFRNDEGRWTCSSSNLYEGSGLFPTQLTGKTATCVGQGGYEGLSAILVEDEAESDHPFVGVIFAGGFPPEPEPPAAE